MRREGGLDVDATHAQLAHLSQGSQECWIIIHQNNCWKIRIPIGDEIFEVKFSYSYFVRFSIDSEELIGRLALRLNQCRSYWLVVRKHEKS
jgi:hypothetical protein